MDHKKESIHNFRGFSKALLIFPIIGCNNAMENFVNNNPNPNPIG